MNSWTPPAELGTNLPRHARMTMMTKVAFAAIPTVLIPVMILLPLLLFYQFENIKTLQERGVEIMGEVTDKRITSTKNGKVYHIDYHFKISGRSGDYVSGSDTVPDTSYGLVEIGYSVPIVYDPMRSEKSMLNINNSLYRQNSGDTLWAFILLVLTLLIPVGIATILLSNNCLKQKKLVEWGKVAPAKILGEKKVRTRQGRVSTIIYQFEDDAGNLIRGMRNNVPAKEASLRDSIETRRRIFENPTVLYDPRNSARNILYPASSFELR